MFWYGNEIKQVTPSQVFVFGSNPEGRHGKGAAKQAIQFGAEYGVGRGLVRNTYALVTKNLKAGYVDGDGRVYENYGGLPRKDIVDNIADLYQLAMNFPNIHFLIPYRNSHTPSLCGYSGVQMYEMFVEAAKQSGMDGLPHNFLFHESFNENETVTLGVTGGRDYTDADGALNALNYLLFHNYLPDDPARIKLVHGDAKGADITMKTVCESVGIETKAIPADWTDFTSPCRIKINKFGDKYNALAGFNRNQTIIDSSDLMVSFWDGKSSGTRDAMSRADAQYKLVHQVGY